MKQVVFAVFLLAMASLTGCLNEEDSSDTTEDNTIEPTGQSGGYTPPEDSSVFIDYGEPGWWSCDEEDDEDCEYAEYIFAESDGWRERENGYTYYDTDNITNQLKFQGWVNKTGNTVTIEGFYNPIDDIGPSVGEDNATGRGRCHTTGYDMQYRSHCTIELYGQDGPYATHPAKYTFILSLGYGYYNSPDRTVIPLTVTIELPFEPVLFTIQENDNYDAGQTITRVF